MNLRDGDLHIVFADTINLARVWQKGAAEGPLYSCEMRNDAVRRWFFKWGWCPRGEYLLGSPSDVHAPAFGEWFTPMFDLKPDGPMHTGKRSGIGIHGGGSGLPDPYAAKQGWVKTHGCLRVQNIDNEAIVRLVRQCQLAGHRAYITVAGNAG